MTHAPALELGRVSLRLVPWWHLAAGAAAAAVIVSSLWRRELPTNADTVPVLRLAAVVLAASAAFLLDDPSEPTLRAVPVGLRTRRLLRVACALPALAGSWAALLWFAGATPGLEPAQRTPLADGDALLPVVALSIEYTGLVLLTLAIAAAALRWSDGETGGRVAAPGVLALAYVAAVLPWGASRWFWALYAPAPSAGAPHHPWWDEWVTAHQRWVLLAALAAAVTWWCSRDRGSSRLRRPTSTAVGARW